MNKRKRKAKNARKRDRTVARQPHHKPWARWIWRALNTTMQSSRKPKWSEDYYKDKVPANDRRRHHQGGWYVADNRILPDGAFLQMMNVPENTFHSTWAYEPATGYQRMLSLRRIVGKKKRAKSQ